jgi:hypothetical protein
MPMIGEDLIILLLKVMAKDSQENCVAASNYNSGSEQSSEENTDILIGFIIFG